MGRVRGRLGAVALAGVLVVGAAFGPGCSSGAGDAASRGPSEGTAGSAPATTVSGGAQQVTARTGEGWTLLVYMVADNDLEPFALDDLAEMAGVAGQGPLQIGVLVDRAGTYSDAGAVNLPHFSGAKRVVVGPGRLDVDAELGTLDTADPTVLADFVTWGVQTLPASRYALVIWNHGGGWTGIGPDESSGAMLTLPSIRSGVAQGLQRAGLDRFDLLGFDACLMATFEVASAVDDLGGVLVASEELEPGNGWDYGAFGVAARDPAVDAAGLATAVVDGYGAAMVAEGEGVETTLSAIDLGAMGRVEEAVGAFAAVLAGGGSDLASYVGQGRSRSLRFGKNPDPAEDPFLVDLGDLAAKVAERRAEVAGPAEGLEQALGAAVLHQWRGEAARAASGLSVFFPPSRDYLDPEYAQLGVAEAWRAYLDDYLAQGAALSAEDQVGFPPGAEPRVVFDADGLTVAGQLATGAGAAVEAYLDVGIVDASGRAVLYVGDVPAEVAEDGSGLVAGLWDLRVVTLSDGEETTQVYASRYADEDGTVAMDIPLSYQAPAQVGSDEYADVLLAVVLDAETDAVLSKTLYRVNDDGSYGELAPDPGGVLYADAPEVDDQGNEVWVPLSDATLRADPAVLGLASERLPAGTRVHVDLVVVDYGDNAAVLATEQVVPA